MEGDAEGDSNTYQSTNIIMNILIGIPKQE